jgi:hypothetical protein
LCCVPTLPYYFCPNSPFIIFIPTLPLFFSSDFSYCTEMCWKDNFHPPPSSPSVVTSRPLFKAVLLTLFTVVLLPLLYLLSLFLAVSLLPYSSSSSLSYSITILLLFSNAVLLLLFTASTPIYPFLCSTPSFFNAVLLFSAVFLLLSSVTPIYPFFCSCLTPVLWSYSYPFFCSTPIYISYTP